MQGHVGNGAYEQSDFIRDHCHFLLSVTGLAKLFLSGLARSSAKILKIGQDVLHELR